MDPQHVVTPSLVHRTHRMLLHVELSGLYFAYGSNMNEAQIRARCTRPVAAGIARLPDHRVEFFGYSRVWDGSMETVVPAPGQEVWGVLYKLSYSDWDRLDAWQDVRMDGNGVYFHYPARVTGPSGDSPVVLLYKKDILGVPRVPSREYLDHIVRGAVHHGLPAPYIDELRRHESAPASYSVPLAPRFDRALLVQSPCSECGGAAEPADGPKSGPGL